MRRNKLKTKMTITVGLKEASKKGIDNIEALVLTELRSFADTKKWKNSLIIFDANESSFIYTIKEER